MCLFLSTKYSSSMFRENTYYVDGPSSIISLVLSGICNTIIILIETEHARTSDLVKFVRCKFSNSL